MRNTPNEHYLRHLRIIHGAETAGAAEDQKSLGSRFCWMYVLLSNFFPVLAPDM
jgi:hypothetical protein